VRGGEDEEEARKEIVSGLLENRVHGTNQLPGFKNIHRVHHRG